LVVEQVVRESSDETEDHLARAGGGQMAKRQAEQVAVHLSRDFDAFYAQALASPQTAADAVKLVVMCRPASLPRISLRTGAQTQLLIVRKVFAPIQLVNPHQVVLHGAGTYRTINTRGHTSTFHGALTLPRRALGAGANSVDEPIEHTD
jgi:hypothetical protein